MENKQTEKKNYLIPIVLSVLTLIFGFAFAPVFNWYEKYFNLREGQSVIAFLAAMMFWMGVMGATVYTWYKKFK